MQARAVGRGRLDLLDQVDRAGVVDVRLGAQRSAALRLPGATADGDGADAHRLGVLERHVPQAAARADDGDPLARPRAGFHEALVDGDARAEHRGDALEVQVRGIRATCAALATAYCWKVPSTVYPDGRADAHSCSSLSRQNEHERHVPLIHLMPAWSPTWMPLTSSPVATTTPAPSCPPTSGILVAIGQSPIMACRSVWHTPEYLTLISTSSGPGCRTGIFLYMAAGDEASGTIEKGQGDLM